MKSKEARLAALNEEYAVVSGSDFKGEFDPKAASIDLLKMKSWNDVIKFIQTHALNNDVAWFWEDTGVTAERVFSGAPEFDLRQFSRSLASVLSNPYAPDYCDNLDDFREMIRVISVRELFHLRDSLRGLVRLAAVALGVAPVCSVVSFKRTDKTVQGEIDLALAGYRRGGLFAEQMLNERNQAIIHMSGSGGVLTDGNTFTFSENDISRDLASRLCCGDLAAFSMNTMAASVDFGPSMAIPDNVGEEITGFGFSLDDGFVLRDPPACVAWWDAIATEVFRAIEHGRVSVCENCGIPFISERKNAKTCSASCRTELCNKRKYQTDPAR